MVSLTASVNASPDKAFSTSVSKPQVLIYSFPRVFKIINEKQTFQILFILQMKDINFENATNFFVNC
jgi:hypothetical protein